MTPRPRLSPTDRLVLKRHWCLASAVATALIALGLTGAALHSACTSTTADPLIWIMSAVVWGFCSAQLFADWRGRP